MVVERLKKLEQHMVAQGFAAMAVNAGPTLAYLTGLNFHLMERPVVAIFAPGTAPTMVLPELEVLKLESLPMMVRTFTYGENPRDWQAVFSSALADLPLAEAKIGVDPRQLRLLEYNFLRGACASASYVDGSEVLSALRVTKDQAEITAMRRAVQIAEDALVATLDKVGIGTTEKEIAAELFLQLIAHGSDAGLPFSPIIAAGPNGANPHAKPSTRPLAPGDLLIVDWGAAHNGYVSDLTRTFAVGEIDDESRRIFEAVRAANRAGRAAGRPGASCAEVDRATRRVIEEAGYGPRFTHRTGHGIGRECHEDPYIRGDNQQLLEVGMAYTVEPGIYLPGKNGVRIEDDVVVTAEGAVSLSTMSRDLRVIG